MPDAAAPLLRLDDVGKDYAKVDARGGRVRLVWDLVRGRAAARVFRALDGVKATTGSSIPGAEPVVTPPCIPAVTTAQP